MVFHSERLNIHRMKDDDAGLWDGLKVNRKNVHRILKLNGWQKTEKPRGMRPRVQGDATWRSGLINFEPLIKPASFTAKTGGVT